MMELDFPSLSEKYVIKQVAEEARRGHPVGIV